MAQIWRRGGQNFANKNWRGVSWDSFFSKFCHSRSRFWEPWLKTWSRQIMFYVIYPKLWRFSKFWNLPVRRRWPLWCQWRPLCGFGNFEKKKLKFWIFFCKGWKLWRILKNYELYTPPSVKICLLLWKLLCGYYMASASPVFFLEILSPSLPILGHNGKHDLARSCFILKIQNF